MRINPRVLATINAAYAAEQAADACGFDFDVTRETPAQRAAMAPAHVALGKAMHACTAAEQVAVEHIVALLGGES